MKRVYQITEYGSFTREKTADGCVSLPPAVFDALEKFVLSNNELLDFMNLSVKRGIGKVITARNYVGVLVLKDGTTVEILPKIASDTEDSGKQAKKIFLRMLRTLKNFPKPKVFQTANVDLEKMDLLEVFIRMFLDEVFAIVKSELKCSYETVQNNGAVFKGKIKFEEQIRYNYAHKERFYVAYDEFNRNCAENKLLKTALQYLYGHTHSLRNKNNIKLLLNSFQDVEISTDYQKDFLRSTPDRNTKKYVSALRWSRIFLMGKSFTSFSGSEVALALLYPMESLFESYVAAKLRKELDPLCYQISVQDNRQYLFDKPSKKFQLKPDIVIQDKMQGVTYIMDTKWKILSSSEDVSQADMYQMYVYQKKYGAKSAVLLYPVTEEMTVKRITEFCDGDGVCIKVCFLDLLAPLTLQHIL